MPAGAWRPRCAHTACSPGVNKASTAPPKDMPTAAARLGARRARLQGEAAARCAAAAEPASAPTARGCRCHRHRLPAAAVQSDRLLPHKHRVWLPAARPAAQGYAVGQPLRMVDLNDRIRKGVPLGLPGGRLCGGRSRGLGDPPGHGIADAVAGRQRHRLPGYRLALCTSMPALPDGAPVICSDTAAGSQPADCPCGRTESVGWEAAALTAACKADAPAARSVA